MASEKGPTDTDLDSVRLAHTTQITKKAETVDAADVIRVDIEYGSFVSSSEDPIKELLIHDSATEEERVGEYDDNINNEYDINSERASDDAKAKLLVAVESDARRENRVLQKLLRAPRYFDYLESHWVACSEFSEDDTKDTAKRGQKSCYICGDINHSGNRCKKVNACIICSGKGHLVKDCPTKNVEQDCASTPCLKCGNTDHDMFSCTNDYDSEDLKAIECYTCKQAGHLCCVEKKAEGSTVASCYHCGQSGHLGPDCTKSNVVTFDLQLFCRRCKERGHSRKQCPKKAKVKFTKRGAAITKRGGAATRAEKRKLYKARRRKNPKQTPTGDTSSSRLLAVAGPYSGNTTNNQP